MALGSRWIVLSGLLSFVWLCCSSPAADQGEIREEIERLRTEVAERLKRIADLEAQLDADRRHVVFEGYCPVTLVTEERWVRGKSDHRIVSGGRVYHFADAHKMQLFKQSPERYTPVMGGCDPVVWLEQGQRILGRRKHGLFWRSQIVLLASEENLDRFVAAPDRYLNPDRVRLWEQATEQVNGTHDGDETRDAEEPTTTTSNPTHSTTARRVRRCRRGLLWRRRCKYEPVQKNFP